MSYRVYWCDNCKIPIIKNSTCTICKSVCKEISKSGVCNPTFKQERKLISLILNKDVTKKNIWYLGSSYYLIDGVRTKLPYINFYKSRQHLQIAEKLKEDIIDDDVIINEEIYLKANERHVNELIYEAENYIAQTLSFVNANIQQKKYEPTVSFSGGKDSTVVSRLVRDALQNESIIHCFGDTTLEFPSTHKYVEMDFRRENPFTPMLPSENDNDFFKLCNIFGPPSKFERWCCTIFKTSSIHYEYQNMENNSLTFLGIRHSESRERQNYERTQTQSKIGSQINAMPIIAWLDCDVWLYIIYKKIAFNEAYRWGYKRVGCWCCPNNSDWSMMLTEMYYLSLSQKWKSMLYDFANKTGKTDVEDYVENGKWKTRKGASGLEVKNVAIADTPCNLSDRARNILLKKKISRDALEFFKPFGQLEIFDKTDATYVSITEKEVVDDSGNVINNSRKICDLIITFGTTVIKVLPAKGVDPLLLVNRIKCQIRKYQYCIRCSACDSICPYGAISTIGENRYLIDETRCKQNLTYCSKCIAKFYNGCITCQILAGKKNMSVDNIDM